MSAIRSSVSPRSIPFDLRAYQRVPGASFLSAAYKWSYARSCSSTNFHPRSDYYYSLNNQRAISHHCKPSLCPRIRTLVTPHTPLSVSGLNALLPVEYLTFALDLRDAADAHVVFEAVRLNLLPLVKRRLTTEERDQLSSGNVFVWEEAEHKGGLERWTDGRRWYCVYLTYATAPFSLYYYVGHKAA